MALPPFSFENGGGVFRARMAPARFEGRGVDMKNIQISQRTGDNAGALLFIGVSVGAYLVSLDFLPPVLPGDPGAAFFPQLIVAVIFLFSLILLIQRLRIRPTRDETADSMSFGANIDLSSFGVSVGSVLALIAVMAYVGFEPAALGFLFILLGWRTGRWTWAFITSVIAVTLMYLTFVAFLKVHLPMLILPKYIYL